MMTYFPWVALLAAFVLNGMAVTAAAAERPDDAAWVEDCPPGVQCLGGPGDGPPPRDDDDAAALRDAPAVGFVAVTGSLAAAVLVRASRI